MYPKTDFWQVCICADPLYGFDAAVGRLGVPAKRNRLENPSRAG
jgi:hypothetical protein